MYNAVMEAVEKLNEVELCVLLAAVLEWSRIDAPGTLEDFKQWMTEMEAEEREAAKRWSGGE